MLFKVLQLFLKVILILIAVIVFIFYLKFLFYPFCLKLGYTLCAAIGEDFFALYQATYNFFHNTFIYGELAKGYFVTPYFMIFKYFPISPLLIGWPFLIASNNAEIAYKFYLGFNIVFYLLGFYGIYLIAKKFKTDSFTKVLVFFLWFTFFPILSDLRMGQYNLISSIFFLFSLIFIIFLKNKLSALSWIISLAFKPISLLNIIYYLKTKNKIAIWSFIICFVIFTGGYLLYHSIYYPKALSDFLSIFISGNRQGWQIHYPDNFSVYTFLGELLYDNNHLFFSIISKIYVVVILSIFLWISYKIKLKNNIKTDSYYFLYAFTTLIMFHREVWESWLSCWLVVITILLVIADNYKEKLFLFLNGIILGTPSLFYFYELNHSNFWRFLLISEKVIPQILIYSYLIYKLFVSINDVSLKQERE